MTIVIRLKYIDEKTEAERLKRVREVVGEDASIERKTFVEYRVFGELSRDVQLKLLDGLDFVDRLYIDR